MKRGQFWGGSQAERGVCEHEGCQGKQAGWAQEALRGSAGQGLGGEMVFLVQRQEKGSGVHSSTF